jgi:hypothetical protein
MIVTRLCNAAFAAAALCLASGCASITGTTNQSVSIKTLEPAGRELSGAACELTNSKGKWFLTTPGSTMITRSNDDMQVICNKQGHEPGRASVVSATKGSMFGNIVFGGGIGAIVDHNTGAAYEYPTFFQVLMGATVKIEPPKDAASEQTSTPINAGAASPAQPAPALKQAGSSTVSLPNGTVEEKLKELKRLHDTGLITKEVYMNQQQKVMESQR